MKAVQSCLAPTSRYGVQRGFQGRHLQMRGFFEVVQRSDLYTRSPPSMRSDAIFMPYFLAAMDRNPRTLCACHFVACMISANVAPLARPISSKIRAPLLSGRGLLMAAFGSGLADLPCRLRAPIRVAVPACERL